MLTVLTIQLKTLEKWLCTSKIKITNQKNKRNIKW